MHVPIAGGKDMMGDRRLKFGHFFENSFQKKRGVFMLLKSNGI